MEIATGKDEPSMMIDTDKFHAIRDAVGAPVGADVATVLTAAITMRDNLDVRNLEFESVKLEVKRKALGLLGMVGLTLDDLQAWRIKHTNKET